MRRESDTKLESDTKRARLESSDAASAQRLTYEQLAAAVPELRAKSDAVGLAWTPLLASLMEAQECSPFEAFAAMRRSIRAYENALKGPPTPFSMMAASGASPRTAAGSASGSKAPVSRRPGR